VAETCGNDVEQARVFGGIAAEHPASRETDEDREA
jgi:hypothetical protein